MLATRDRSKDDERDARFLLVRSDGTRATTCFSEDAGTHVRVHDVLHCLDGSNARMRVVRDTREEPRGVHVLVGAAATGRGDVARAHDVGRSGSIEPFGRLRGPVSGRADVRGGARADR